MARHIVIYSHGFGARSNDRGLFTDIAAGMPELTHRMFDYNKVDEAANAITVAPVDDQASALRRTIAQARAAHPDAIIDLVCHSQGCLVAALACAPNIRKTIFIAPAPDADLQDKIKRWRVRYGTQFTTEGTSYLERKDGSTTIVPPEYWQSLKNLDAQQLFNVLAGKTELIIITATQDEVLGEVVFDRLSPEIKVVAMATGHNFEQEARPELTHFIANELTRD